MAFNVDSLLDLWTHPWQPGPAAEDAFRAVYTDPVTVNGTPLTAEVLVTRSIALREALADQQREVLQVVETAGAVAVAFRLTGRHAGPLTTTAGVLSPTGRMLSMRIIDILTLTDGKISEVWMVADELGTLTAIAAVTLVQPDAA